MIEKIILLRETFAQLPLDLQFKEARRMMRIATEKKPIKMAPLDNPDAELSFHRVEEVVKYLFNMGYTRAATSNIYKALRGDRGNAYGHRIWYGED